jgi:hypothetical protein
MGMFDKPQFLTGENGFVEVGDTFFLHNARIDGTRPTANGPKPNAKLLVSKTREETPIVVYTTGTGISGQVSRMDANDRSGFPMEVRLDEVPSGKGNPTKVLTPADQPPPLGGGGGMDDAQTTF